MHTRTAVILEGINAYPFKFAPKITEVKGVHKSKIYRLQSLQSAEQFALRITPAVDEKILLNEIHILNSLSHIELTIAALLKTSNGNFYVESPGQAATLRAWLKGQHPDPTVEILQRLGRSLAIFHTFVTKLPNPNTSQLLSEDVADWEALNRPSMEQFSKRSTLWRAVKALRSSNLPEGTIHGDFHRGNVIVNGNAVGILDMERSGKGFLIRYCTGRH